MYVAVCVAVCCKYTHQHLLTVAVSRGPIQFVTHTVPHEEGGGGGGVGGGGQRVAE